VKPCSPLRSPINLGDAGLAGCQGRNSQLPDHRRLNIVRRDPFTSGRFGACGHDREGGGCPRQGRNRTGRRADTPSLGVARRIVASRWLTPTAHTRFSSVGGCASSSPAGAQTAVCRRRKLDGAFFVGSISLSCCSLSSSFVSRRSRQLQGGRSTRSSVLARWGRQPARGSRDRVAVLKGIIEG
jgi:hypothetical protein